MHFGRGLIGRWWVGIYRQWPGFLQRKEWPISWFLSIVVAAMWSRSLHVSYTSFALDSSSVLFSQVLWFIIINLYEHYEKGLWWKVKKAMITWSIKNTFYRFPMCATYAIIDSLPQLRWYIQWIHMGCCCNLTCVTCIWSK